MNAENPLQEDSPAAKPSPSGKWLRRGLELLIIVAIIFGVRAWQQRDVVKGSPPALSATLLDGKPYVLPIKPAQPVLVHFWATWCPICRTEQSSIASLAHDNPNVISIAMQSGSASAVQQYMREQAVSFPVINDPEGLISSGWGVHAVPASFIIGTDGTIHDVEIGFTTGLGLRFRLWLASL